ncbi:MAG TPA: SDR family oxidoreductase [Solirubrobacteraceae bacterium]|nr:SDR family oxidoreductase [Solirubrobacteraceae bacterium]
MSAGTGRDGRVALVTGASRRCAIGAAIARRLVADGLRVLVHSFEPADIEAYGRADEGGAEALTVELAAAGGEVAHVSLDLADPGAPAALVGAAHHRFGGLDVLVANHARSTEMDLAHLTAAELDLTFAVNTRATLLLVRALAAGRAPGPGGRVVLFTSGQYHGAMANELPYVASKGALHQLTPSLGASLVGRGITVNCVDPGPTDTGYADPERLREVAAAAPSGRWGTPQDAARLVAWLVSEEGAWISGQVIASDGGWSVRPRWEPPPGP